LSKAFTLIELLIVIAIIAILSIVVVLTVNPAELLRQSRDSTRTNDLSTLQTALNLYVTDTSVSGSLQLGLINTLYVSLPDASSTCGSWGLPALPTGWSYHCATATSSKNIDANGWIPVNLKTMSLGSSLGSLPIDPINSSSTGLYYTYQTDGQKYELTSLLESSKYKAQYAQNPQLSGYPEVLAEGSNLSLSPLWNPSCLVGYWPLDEGTGTVAGDMSGNGNNGTATGTLPYYTAGKIGPYAGNFDGSDNVVRTTQLFTNFNQNITVSFWAKSNGVSTNQFCGFVSNADQAPQEGWGIVATNCLTASPAIKLFDGVAYRGTSNPSILSGQWGMYSVVINTTTVNFYENGAFRQSDAYAPSGGVGIPISLGSFWAQVGSTLSFNGNIDDARVYNRVLSSAEVQALYNAEK
jgi:prepilin-type N-terminal cleavage/methylation domain-containing protein